MDKNKIKTWALILAPVILAGGYIAYIKLIKPSNTTPASDPANNTPTSSNAAVAKKSASVTPSNSFPLQNGVGSRSNPNVGVMALQTALGIGVDGIFGSQTQSALTAATGKTSIADANDLNNVLNTIEGATSAIDYGSASDGLIFDVEGGATNLWVNSDSAWRGVYNQNGVWMYNQDQFRVSQGDSFLTSDYTPYLKDDANGFLVVRNNTTPSPFNSNVGSMYLELDPTTIVVT